MVAAIDKCLFSKHLVIQSSVSQKNKMTNSWSYILFICINFAFGDVYRHKGVKPAPKSRHEDSGFAFSLQMLPSFHNNLDDNLHIIVMTMTTTLLHLAYRVTSLTPCIRMTKLYQHTVLLSIVNCLDLMFQPNYHTPDQMVPLLLRTHMVHWDRVCAPSQHL